MLTSPPRTGDIRDSQRLTKLYDKGITECHVVCLRLLGLDLSRARLNHQGVVLQRTGVPARFDYIVKVDIKSDPITGERVYFAAFAGQSHSVVDFGEPGIWKNALSKRIASLSGASTS